MEAETLWDFGLSTFNLIIFEGKAKKKFPGALKKLHPCLTEQEARDLAGNVIKKLNEADLADAIASTPNLRKTMNPNLTGQQRAQYLPNPQNLTPRQRKVLNKIIEKLPESDQAAIDKIKSNCCDPTK